MTPPSMVGMTKTLSKEWGRLKVWVNCVAFGFIETRLTRPNDDPATKIEIEGKVIQAGVPAEMLGALKAIVPLGRAGTPDEAAGGVHLLCSRESVAVTRDVVPRRRDACGLRCMCE